MKRATFALLFSSSSLFAMAPAWAQDAAFSEENTVTVTARVNKGGIELNQPSTAGSRLGLTPLETPASVSVVQGDLIRNLTVLSVADAQTLAPGISSNPAAGNGGITLTSRGFYGANSVAQLYDGVQLFNAGGVILFPVDPWNLDRIEFLAGPASVLYGSGAIGGAFNVVTKKPNPTTFGFAGQASAGSFDTYHGSVDVTGPITDTLAYRFNISGNKSATWIDRAGSDNMSLSGSLRYAPTDTLVFTLSDDYGLIHPSTYEGTPVVNNVIQTQLRFQNYNLSDAAIEFSENRARLRAEWKPGEGITFTNDFYLIGQWRMYRESYTYTYTPATDLVHRTNFRDIHAYQRQYGDHGFLTLKTKLAGIESDTDLGFDVNNSYYDRYDNLAASGYTGSSFVNAFNFDPGTFFQAGNGSLPAVHQYTLTLQQYGFFGEQRFKILPFWSLSAGFRYDHYGTSRFDFPTNSSSTGTYSGVGWNVGTVVNPTPTTSLYAQYATAVDPVTSLASIGASQIGFQLSPAHQVEVGAKVSLFGGRLEATLSAYEIVKKNLLTPSLANPSVSEQVGQQSSRGLEASLGAHITNTLFVQANGSILRAKFDSFDAVVSGVRRSLAGFRPQMVPEQTANLVALWQFKPQWQARVRVSHTGDRFTDNTNLIRMPAFTVVNLGLRYNINPHFNLDFAADNITDAIYAQAASAGASTPFILGAPRNVRGTVNFSF